MGLCLKSNKNTIDIHMSYSAFNRMRYLILAYIQNEKLETVSNNNYLYHFISAYSDDSYSFKYFIEHSDSDGEWNKEQIDILISEFKEHYSRIVEHNKKHDDFQDGYDDEILFIPLIKLLNESQNGKITFS